MAGMRRPVLVLLLTLATCAASAQGATRPRFKEFTPPPGTASQIAPGPDGNMWFTSAGAGNYIGRITPKGRITTFPLPTPAASPDFITRGPDGNLWFTESAGNKIGRITPAGAITEFPLPNPGSSPRGITSGPDGALWFVEFHGDRVGRMTTSGQLTEFPLSAGGLPVSIVTGPDRNLWFTQPGFDSLARITPSGQVTTFGVTNASGPEGITSGRDGFLWYTEDDGDRIGRLATDGTAKQFVNGITPGATPSRITVAADGSLWFTELIGGRVARITTTGKVSQFSVGKDTKPWGIAAGPGNRIWFAKAAANRIVRFTPPDLPGVEGVMTYSFLRDNGRTRFTAMKVERIARNAKLRLKCRGGGCPKGKTFRNRRSVKLGPRFRRPLSPGARVEVRLTGKGASPKLFLFRTRATKAPTFQIRCLPRGAKKPRRCAK